MKYTVIIFSFIMVACGKAPKNYTLPVQTVHDVQLGYQGYYLLPNGGYADIVNDTGSLQDVTALRLVVTNADSSTGLIPLTTISNIATVNGKLYYSGNTTYAVGNNVKADVGNAVLTGSLFTMLTFSKDNNGDLNIRVQISNSTGLVFDHIIVSE